MDTNQETETERQNRECDDRHFGGSEPFNDGDTPERDEARAQRAAEWEAQQKRMKDAISKRRSRVEFEEAQPLLKLKKSLSKYVFDNTVLSDEEKKKVRILSGCMGWGKDEDGNDVDLGKHHRRGIGIVFCTKMRAQFYAGNGMRELCIRPIAETAEVARIADLARYIFWEYRKPGFLGVDLADSHLNFSLNRAVLDMENEPRLVAMLNQFRDELVKLGHFSKGRELAPRNKQVRRRYFQTDTLMAEMKSLGAKVAALTAAPSELAPSAVAIAESTVSALNARIDELAQRLNEATPDSAETMHAMRIRSFAVETREELKKLEKVVAATTPNEETIRQVVDVAMRAHGENAHQLNTIVSEHSFEIGTLKGKLESHVSHFATAHPVTINAMNKLQNDHVTFVSTALSAIDALNQRLLTLSEIVMRQSQHIEALEARPTLEAVFEPTCAIGEGGTQ